MSTGTNKERLEQNNELLEDIKNQIEDLPEKQDIEPVYSKSKYDIVKPNLSLSLDYNNTLIHYDEMGDYYVKTSYKYTGNNISTSIKLYKLEDEDLTEVSSQTVTGDKYGAALTVSYMNGCVYFVQGNYGGSYSGWTIKLYKINMETGVKTLVGDISNQPSYNPTLGHFGNDIITVPPSNWNVYGSTIVQIDYQNDKIKATGLPVESSVYGCNAVKNGVLYYYDKVTSSLKQFNLNGRTVKGFNKYNDKIFLSDGIYSIDSTGIGEKLSDEVLIIGSSLTDCYYYKSNTLLKFNEETNSIESELTLDGIKTALSTNGSLSFIDSDNKVNIFVFKEGSKIIGIKYNGAEFSTRQPLNFNISSADVRQGSQVCDTAGNIVLGTMPNNGELTITPSTQSQSIPAGYTSGGTVQAVTSEIDNNIQPEYIKKGISILGTEGTLAGGELVKVIERYNVENLTYEKIGTSSYYFSLNSNGYYESNNKGKASTYCLCKVSFYKNGTGDLTIDYISSGESNYDFGIFSNLDTTLNASSSADSSNVKKSCKGESSTEVKTLTYSNVPEGNHFIYIKYIKDGSGDSYNDSLQFKFNLVDKSEEIVVLKTMFYLNEDDMNSDLEQEENTTGFIYNEETSKVEKAFRFDGAQWNDITSQILPTSLVSQEDYDYTIDTMKEILKES